MDCLKEENRLNSQVVTNIFGVLDGENLSCADYVTPGVQNIFYNEYSTCVNVTDILVFNFKEEVIDSNVNFPGS